MGQHDELGVEKPMQASWCSFTRGWNIRGSGVGHVQGRTGVLQNRSAWPFEQEIGEKEGLCTVRFDVRLGGQDSS
jgi:hypothetical protein